jgi:murein DD-endopeptidase MepM/ murein hydrolase activator NlpD
MSSDANPFLGSSYSSRLVPSSSSTDSNSESDAHRPTLPGKPLKGFAMREVATPMASVALAGSFGGATVEESTPAVQSDGLSTFVHRCQEQVRHTLADQVTPLRLAGHLAVLVVGATILILSQVQLPDWNFSLETLPNNALSAAASANPQTGAEPQVAPVSEAMTDALQRSAVPFTVPQEKPREEIEVYAVKSGDTVLGIAAQFGIQPETIMWANATLESNPDRLAVGDQLNILPVDGVLHEVKPGDTLSGLAAKYKVDVNNIIGYTANELADASAALTIGSKVVIPGGTKPFVTPEINTGVRTVDAPTDAVKGSGTFSWPTSGNITQQFWGGHRAIDIGSWVGAPVKSADSGYVVLAGGGWNGGYGNHVIIDHGNGFATLYAHLNSIFVKPGESVSRGQQIGTVGNTGNSTGPHLHFEIRYQGTARNPYNWLP